MFRDDQEMSMWGIANIHVRLRETTTTRLVPIKATESITGNLIITHERGFPFLVISVLGRIATSFW